jgi:hypothetical protein
MQIRVFLAIIVFGTVTAALAQQPDSGDRLAKLAARLKSLDANNNGQIDADEVDGTAKMLLERFYPNGPIQFPLAISEIMKAAEARYGSGGGSAPAAPAATPAAAPAQPAAAAPVTTPSGGTTSSAPSVPAASPTPSTTASAPPMRSTPTSIAPPVKAKTKWSTGKERLAGRGLPDWFLSKADADGQILMSEYTDRWTSEAVAQFEKYDLNHDGIITAEEVLKVEKSRGRR